MQKFEDKYDLLKRAYQDSQLKKGSIALLQYLVYKSNRTHCFPAVDTIAAALGCCRRTVQYNMRKLEKAGYIIRKDRWYNHQQLSNQYCFSIGITEEKFNTQISTANSICKGLAENFQEADMDKVQCVKEIYNSNLSAGEKQLLTNFCFRANKKGIVYGTVSSLKKGIGMRGLRPGCIRDNFYQWLLQLREKGLIDIKTVYIKRKKHLIIHIRNMKLNSLTTGVKAEKGKIEIPEKSEGKRKTLGREKQNEKCPEPDCEETKGRHIIHKIKKMVRGVLEGMRKILRI